MFRAIQETIRVTVQFGCHCDKRYEKTILHRGMREPSFNHLIQLSSVPSLPFLELSGDVAQFGALPDVSITAGRSSTSVRLPILSDGITEIQTVSTISFRSLTPGAIVATGEDSVTVVIADSPGETR